MHFLSSFIYFLLTEFEGRNVSYGPSFSPIDLWSKREARGPSSEGERRGFDREGDISTVCRDIISDARKNKTYVALSDS